MDPLLRPVFEVFESELREQVSEVADAIIQSGEEPDPVLRKDRMDAVYRYAHSMKGNAGTLGMPDLQELAHAMESLLNPYRDGARPLGPDLARALMAALDLGPRRVAEALAGREERDAAVDAMTASLGALAQGGGSHPSPTGEAARGLPVKEASEPAPPQAQGTPQRRAPDRATQDTVRVAVDRLARLDRVMDDLRDARGALEHRLEHARRIYWNLEEALANADDAIRAPLRQTRDQLRALLRGMTVDVGEMSARMGDADEELRLTRMLPVETVLAPLPRAVWEHAQATGKKVRLSTRGAEVALDRRLLDELKDPLVHLVRNAVDHGVELPAERLAAGKPEEGQLRVEVEQRGPRVFLSLADDGRGVSLDRVRQSAVKKGLLSSEAAAALDEASAHDLLFSSGFSTANEVSMTSGRGVGLDVVRERLLKVGGKVTLESKPGKGARFILELPLTLATQQALLVEAGGHQLALPLSAVHSAHYVIAARGRAPAEVTVEGQPLPLRPLAQLLGGQVRESLRSGFPTVAVRLGDRLLALRVDRLLGEREVVLRPLPPELGRIRHLAAAASLGDGQVVFVLAPRALGDLDRDRAGGKVTPGGRPKILVADDSVTTRALHRQVLESAGFEVDTAADGEDAWRLLGGGVAYRLLVSDIRMPRLDGLGLCERVRRDEKWGRLPVVLVSSMDTDEDRQRAERAGASALLGKAAYERGELIRLVKGFLP